MKEETNQGDQGLRFGDTLVEGDVQEPLVIFRLAENAGHLVGLDVHDLDSKKGGVEDKVAAVIKAHIGQGLVLGLLEILLDGQSPVELHVVKDDGSCATLLHLRSGLDGFVILAVEFACPETENPDEAVLAHGRKHFVIRRESDVVGGGSVLGKLKEVGVTLHLKVHVLGEFPGFWRPVFQHTLLVGRHDHVVPFVVLQGDNGEGVHRDGVEGCVRGLGIIHMDVVGSDASPGWGENSGD